ncbi:peptidase A2 domain-containing protein [Trichonephila clavipes]|nr:peptidase A2 domain-containing protein [Trichonephila clavipes]
MEGGEENRISISIYHINNLALNGQVMLSKWTKTTKKVSNAHPIGPRRKGKQNLRWIDGLEKDPLAARGLLATDHVILNHGQVTWTTPELAPPLLTTTPHQQEDVSALDRFNVHRCPTRRVFSGTGLELVTKQATVRYLYHSATAATSDTLKPMKGNRTKEQKEKLGIEEQKEKLRIEEREEKLRIEEREEKLRFEQLRLDEQKRKDEFELEKLRIQTQSKLGADTSKESDTKFLVKEISKFIHRFDLKEDISLYLKLFERQTQRLNIDQENWVSHLLGLLPTEVSHIIAREPDDKANSYEHVKDLLLKRFKLTPEKFRQLFVTHQKASERTWIDFYHELNTYFNGWIVGLKIDTFNKLSDLIITDQLKRKTPFEFKEYYLDEWANMNSPVQLAEKLEEFEGFKRTLKQKSSSPFVKKQEFRFTEKNRRYESPGKFEYNKKDKKFPASTNYNKHYEAPVTKYESVQRYQDSAQKGYYNKNYEKHSNHNASKHAQTNYSKSQKFKEPPKETCTLIVKEGLRTKEIFFGKVKITALIDSGSTVSLLRENSSRRIMGPTKLSKNNMLLTGIGEAQVTTIGSFEHKFKIDDENYSLTWHVVPTDKLKFEAVIGSDLLEQASISFTKEGVKFNKYENHAQLMQISAENLQEELDLRHVENRQIKKELEKLIQDYKPEKQHLLTSQ